MSEILREIHYFDVGLPLHQLNLYSVCLMPLPAPKLPAIVCGTLTGNITIIENTDGGTPEFWHSSDFLSLGGGADIVSVDAFIIGPAGAEIPVIIVSVVKQQGHEPPKGFLHIYGLSSRVGEPWTKISSDSQVIELEYIPCLLTHQITGTGAMLLVSGMDNRLHAMAIHPPLITEIVGSAHPLPELAHLPSSILSMDVLEIGHYRISAAGCQDGYLQLAVTEAHEDSASPPHIVTTQVDGPISSIKLYQPKPSAVVPQLRQSPVKGVPETSGDTPLVHLVLGGAMGFACVFRNILVDQLSNLHHLPASEQYDSVLSVGVADLDFDGEMEILVTTYGRELLVYKEDTGGDMSRGHSQTVTPALLVPDETQPRPIWERRGRGKHVKTLSLFGLPAGAHVSTDVLESVNSVPARPVKPLAVTQSIIIDKDRDTPDAEMDPRNRFRGRPVHRDSSNHLGESVLGTSPLTSEKRAAYFQLDVSNRPTVRIGSEDSGIDTDHSRTPSIRASPDVSLSPARRQVSSAFSSPQPSRTHSNVHTPQMPHVPLDLVFQQTPTAMPRTSRFGGDGDDDGDLTDSNLNDIGGPRTDASGPITATVNDDTEMDLNKSGASTPFELALSYDLIWQRSFAMPLYKTLSVDLIGDGVEEIILSSLYGIHILQPDIVRAKEVLAQRSRTPQR